LLAECHGFEERLEEEINHEVAEVKRKLQKRSRGHVIENRKDRDAMLRHYDASVFRRRN